MLQQLTDALLEFETEKSAWSATEKVLLKSDEISRKEIAELSVNLAKVWCSLSSVIPDWINSEDLRYDPAWDVSESSRERGEKGRE